MASPSKPQGKKPGNKAVQGGLFVDPLDKWVPDAPDLDGGPETSGKGPNGTPTRSEKIREVARNVLINDVDKGVEKVEKLIAKLARPGLSRSERNDLQRELVNARKAFQKISDSSDELSAELRNSRRLEAEAYSKLSRLKTWKANAGDAGLGAEEKKSLLKAEESLKNFIKSTAAFRTGENHKNEDVRKEVFHKLDTMLDRITDLPEYVQDMFKDEDKKIDKLLKQQAEARKFVASQNAAITSFLWKTADKIGFGRANLGNAIRVGRAVYNAPKTIRNKYDGLRDKVGRATAYVNKTLEMRRLAKADIVTDDQLNASTGTDSKKQQGMFEKYLSSSERFRRRLLDRFGRKKKPEEKQDKSMLDGFLDFFGKEGFLKRLLGLAAKVSAVAIAGAVGYWVGSKIWEKIAPWVGEKFNNISGNDEAGRIATAPVHLNSEANFNKAAEIQRRLQTPGTKVTDAESTFYADFSRSNNLSEKDLSGKWTPKNANQAKMANPTSGDISRADRKLEGVNSAQAVVVPPSVASASPTVSKGGQVSDVLSRTTQSGSADVEGLNPAMKSNLANMANEYYMATGKKLQINSANRSMDEQARLYKSMPKGMAAAPGSSLHNFGLAVDIQSAQANELHNLGLLQKYGFVRPIATEKWHVQPAGMTVAAAKAGIYSADAPMDQGAKLASARPDSQAVPSAEARIPLQTSDGGTVGTGSGGSAGIISTASKKSASDIPTFDTTDGMLTGMNMGVIAS